MTTITLLVTLLTLVVFTTGVIAACPRGMMIKTFNEER